MFLRVASRSSEPRSGLRPTCVRWPVNGVPVGHRFCIVLLLLIAGRWGPGPRAARFFPLCSNVRSLGRFHPAQMAKLRRKQASNIGTYNCHSGGLSVAVPTMESRHMLYEQLWSVVDGQTWLDKELIIVDTYHKNPSAFSFERKS